jgi:hypothetical protein
MRKEICRFPHEKAAYCSVVKQVIIGRLAGHRSFEKGQAFKQNTSEFAGNHCGYESGAP